MRAQKWRDGEERKPVRVPRALLRTGPRSDGWYVLCAVAVASSLLVACGDDGAIGEDAGIAGMDAGGSGGMDAAGGSGGTAGRRDGAIVDAGDDADGSMDAGGTADADMPPEAGRDAGCVPPGSTVMLDYDFEAGKQGWTAGFADLPENPDRELYGLETGIRPLPDDLPEQDAFFVASHNRSDDVWMYLARRLTSCQGMVAGQTYSIEFTLDFASNAGEGCVGIGGAPGESVYLKVGASPESAETLIDEGRRVFSLDKGNQSQPGSESTLAGNIASPENSCTDETQFTLLHRATMHRFEVTASDEGELTVFVGTDSGFEGFTPLYYDRIRIRLMPVQ